jgi:hypothetical protein
VHNSRPPLSSSTTILKQTSKPCFSSTCCDKAFFEDFYYSLEACDFISIKQRRHAGKCTCKHTQTHAFQCSIKMPHLCCYAHTHTHARTHAHTRIHTHTTHICRPWMVQCRLRPLLLLPAHMLPDGPQIHQRPHQVWNVGVIRSSDLERM